MTTDAELGARYAALAAADARELVAPLVEVSGGVLLDVRREDLGYRPGRDAHARFAADVDRDGQVHREGWVVHAGAELPPATLRVEGDAGAYAAWRVRDDPGLPALRLVLDLHAVSAMLVDLGVPVDGLAVELVAYRPQRRAVVEVTTSSHRLFLKCVPPALAAGLHARHLACRAVDLPVPHPVGVDEALGLLVLTPLRGAPLRDALLRAGAPLPDPAQVVDVLDAFARVELDAKARSPLRQSRGHAAVLREVLPPEAGRVDDLVAALRPREDDGPRCVVHGDFYDDQLLVEGGSVVGVVDVDGAGLGHPADDAANLLAHLLVLRTLVPSDAGAHAWLPAVAERLLPRSDPAELARRTSAVLVGLATWPHTQHEPGWEEQTRELLGLAESVQREGVARVVGS